MNTLGENLELIAEARLWIRKSSNAFDSEIVQTMDSCILDLKNAGVRKLDTGDALIRQALKLSYRLAALIFGEAGVQKPELSVVYDRAARKAAVFIAIIAGDQGDRQIFPVSQIVAVPIR